jgi:hypothetical protein
LTDIELRNASIRWYASDDGAVTPILSAFRRSRNRLAKSTFLQAGAYDGETEVILDLLGLVYDAAGDASLEGLLVRWV